MQRNKTQKMSQNIFEAKNDTFKHLIVINNINKKKFK